MNTHECSLSHSLALSLSFNNFHSHFLALLCKCSLHICPYMYVCMYIYICTYVYIYIYIYICIYIYIHVCVHTSIYISIPIASSSLSIFFKWTKRTLTCTAHTPTKQRIIRHLLLTPMYAYFFTQIYLFIYIICYIYIFACV